MSVAPLLGRPACCEPAKPVFLDPCPNPGTPIWRLALSALTRFLGDSPLRVILKLLVVSFLVGLVMNAFGWSPMDVFYGIQKFFIDLWNLGFHAIDRFLGYILLGAAIVIPAFILLRIASYRK
jgi:hypothetical protein